MQAEISNKGLILAYFQLNHTDIFHASFTFYPDMQRTLLAELMLFHLITSLQWILLKRSVNFGHKVNKESLPSTESRCNIEISTIFSILFLYFQACFVSLYRTRCSQSWDTVSQCLATRILSWDSLLSLWAFWHSRCVCVCVSPISLCLNYQKRLYSSILFCYFILFFTSGLFSHCLLLYPLCSLRRLWIILHLSFLFVAPSMTISLHLASLGCINQTGYGGKLLVSRLLSFISSPVLPAGLFSFASQKGTVLD